MTNKFAIGALLFAITLPLQTMAAPRERISEASARTKEDHLRLAAYFDSKAQTMRINLTQQEQLVAYWNAKSWMRDRTKIPNPLFSARNLADSYRWQWTHALERAAWHRRMAEEL